MEAQGASLSLEVWAIILAIVSLIVTALGVGASIYFFVKTTAMATRAAETLAEITSRSRSLEVHMIGVINRMIDIVAGRPAEPGQLARIQPAPKGTGGGGPGSEGPEEPEPEPAADEAPNDEDVRELASQVAQLIRNLAHLPPTAQGTADIVQSQAVAANKVRRLAQIRRELEMGEARRSARDVLGEQVWERLSRGDAIEDGATYDQLVSAFAQVGESAADVAAGLDRRIKNAIDAGILLETMAFGSGRRYHLNRPRYPGYYDEVG